ncbi:MAG: competence protein ComEC, partial [Acidobacteriaceae bacterium]|nr:competence protein ComEC [Acidobacteriaceae bacterium]
MRSAGRALKTGRVNAPNPDLWPKTVARIPGFEFRRAPLLMAVVWFALGEVMALNRKPAIILLIAIVLLSLLTLAALRYSLRTAIVPVATVWIAIGCWCAEIQPAPPTQHALAAYADGLSRQLRGRVVRVRALPPQQNDSDHDKETGWWPEKEADEEAAAVGALSIDLQVDSMEELTPDISRMVPMRGGVRLNVIADKLITNGITTTAARKVFPALQCGDEVEAPMRIKVAERYRDPGAWQYADYLLAQGIGAHASVRASKITPLDESSVSLSAHVDRSARLQCRIYAALSWASGRVLDYVHSKANR